jgi:hypothetical protein
MYELYLTRDLDLNPRRALAKVLLLVDICFAFPFDHNAPAIPR